MIYMFGDNQWIDFEAVEILQRVNKIEVPAPTKENPGASDIQGPGIQVKLNGRQEFMLLEMAPDMILTFLDKWSEYVLSHNTQYLNAEFPVLPIPLPGTNQEYECNVCTSRWVPTLKEMLDIEGLKCAQCGSTSVSPKEKED